MKIFFVMLVLLTAVSSCSTLKKNPETEIQEYIRKNIINSSSYTPVSFGKPGTDSTRATNDPQYVALNDSIKKYKKLSSPVVDTPKQFPMNPATQMSSLDKIYQAENQQYTIINNFKSRPCGFIIKHVFKMQNKSGAIVLDSLYFHFDSSMNLRDDSDYIKQLNGD